MGSSSSAFSSSASSRAGSQTELNMPEPTISDKLNRLLRRRPCRVDDVVRVIGIIEESSDQAKLQMAQSGVVRSLLDLIRENTHLESNHPIKVSTESLLDVENLQQRKKSRSNSQPLNVRNVCNAPDDMDSKRNGSASSTMNGVGYGRGSTKSHWNVARTVAEQLAQEEFLSLLLCTLNAFLWGKDVSSKLVQMLELQAAVESAVDSVEHLHLCRTVLEEMAEYSPVLPLLEYHLTNDSIFDVSQHLEFYQSLVEMAAALALIPEFLPYLVQPQSLNSKSIAKELLPKFRHTLSAYPASLQGRHASPDFVLMAFIQKADSVAESIVTIARRYESDLPLEKRVKTAVASMRQQRTKANEPVGNARVPSAISVHGKHEGSELDAVYAEMLQDYQIQTHKLLNDASKPIFGFSFKRELRNVNPFSVSHKDRTKRIAKELASMHNSLPLNASNSIFVCMDETRCDVLKVLISGPDDTPYQNGLFEFDVFFPSSYPQSPPKCAFLTTGNGAVRFNPNLYNDGKICLSILGTWEGRPEEKWNPLCSLLQVLISIQGLIFVKHPYFNEPGFERFQGSVKGEEFSRKYNLHIENATLVYAIMNQYKDSPPYFREAIRRHFWAKRESVIKQAERWLQDVAKEIQSNANDPVIVDQDGMMDSIFVHSTVQRQNVRKLLDEFRDMKDPTTTD